MTDNRLLTPQEKLDDLEHRVRGVAVGLGVQSADTVNYYSAAYLLAEIERQLVSPNELIARYENIISVGNAFISQTFTVFPLISAVLPDSTLDAMEIALNKYRQAVADTKEWAKRSHKK